MILGLLSNVPLFAQISSRHKNCRIGELMVDNQHTWNSTPSSLLPGIQQTKHLFKHQFSGKILIADKSDDHVFYRRLSNFVTAAAWYGLVCKANGMARTIVFPFRTRREKVIDCIFGHDFLSSCTTIVLGIANYPSICISCCSNDLSLLLLCLDLLSLGSENVSFRGQIFASIWLQWHV